MKTSEKVTTENGTTTREFTVQFKNQIVRDLCLAALHPAAARNGHGEYMVEIEHTDDQELFGTKIMVKAEPCCVDVIVSDSAYHGRTESQNVGIHFKSYAKSDKAFVAQIAEIEAVMEVAESIYTPLAAQWMDLFGSTLGKYKKNLLEDLDVKIQQLDRRLEKQENREVASKVEIRGSGTPQVRDYCKHSNIGNVVTDLGTAMVWVIEGLQNADTVYKALERRVKRIEDHLASFPGKEVEESTGDSPLDDGLPF